MKLVLVATVALSLSCAASSQSPFSYTSAPPTAPDTEDAAAVDAGAGALLGDSAAATDAVTACSAPDMLIVLDRTLSMGQTPTGDTPANTPAGHAKTKWVLATSAVRAVVAPPADQHLRFGLEVFPLDPKVVDGGGSGSCVSLTQFLGGALATNTHCEPGEVLLSPATGTGATIASLLDPDSLRLCISTPIASALATASGELAAIAVAGHAQYVLLVTDGGETCNGDVVGEAQKLAAAGVETFVVGFGGIDGGSAGVNVGLLDDLACAGMTSAHFPADCAKTPTGFVAASKHGPPLFRLAEDGAALESALAAVTSSVCCDCAQ